jgi:hypothetical protein
MARGMQEECQKKQNEAKYLNQYSVRNKAAIARLAMKRPACTGERF